MEPTVLSFILKVGSIEYLRCNKRMKLIKLNNKGRFCVKNLEGSKKVFDQ